MDANTIIEFLNSLVHLNELYIIAGMLAAQIFIGVFTAMIKGEFDVQEFFNFYKKLLVYFSAYLGAGILSGVLTDWGGYQAVMFGAVCAMITDKILQNLNDAGLPVPDGIPVRGAMNGLGAVAGQLLGAKERADV